MNVLVLLLSASFAADPGVDTIKYGVCVQCHGAHGEGRPELGAPRIGDLEASYIQTQLQAFHDGTRGTHPGTTHDNAMAAIAAGLPDTAYIKTLADLASALDPQLHPPGEPVEGGAAAYASCIPCHGADAAGVGALGPALLYQDPTYLTRQLTWFRDGLRGGTDGHPMSQQMAAMAQGLDDAAIQTLVAHIASLRPPVPTLDHPEVTLGREEGLAAFADIYAVAQHPRCLNCHPDGDAPLHTDASVPHAFGITRFSPLEGVHCSTCHPAAPVGDGQAPLPPADPMWSMPPAAMAFQNRSPGQLCRQLLDPAVNGGRGLTGLTEHIAVDHLLQTSWHSGRSTPPISHEALVERFRTWGAAGGPCPE